MRITKLRAVQPSTPGSPPDWRTHLGQIVVEVETNEGLKGIGIGGGGAAGIHVIETVLTELLVGIELDELQVEDVHRMMCEHTAFYGQKGLVVMAISGVDLALWDLRGKAAGLPIAKILNDKVDLEKQIPTYATVFDDATAREALDRGVSAVKLHVERFGNRPSSADIKKLVEEVRCELGDDGMLAIDAFARWDVETTLRIADAIAEFNVAWIEEPVPPDRLDDYAAIVEGSPVPIAGGEHEYLADGFQNLIERRLHAVLQPDINWCGGMTTMVEIYRMAGEAGLRVCPHRGSEVFALHAIAALDPQPLAESPRAWFNCLTGAPKIEDGLIRLNDAPGFGISFDL